VFAALFVSLFFLAGAEPASPSAGTAQPTPATPAEGSSGAAAADADADKSRMVCRRESKPNTRFTYKVCKTVGEWEERTKAAQESFGEVQGRPTIKICSPTGGCD
jgi:hypothetical protein